MIPSTTPRPLDTLYLATHVGYGIDTMQQVLPETHDLFDALRYDLASSVDPVREAVVVLLHQTEAEYRNARSAGTKDIRWPLANLVRDMQHALPERVGLVFGVENVTEEGDCLRHVPAVMRAVADMQAAIGERTQLICVGETAEACVPAAASNFRTLLGITSPAVVPLELTDARSLQPREDYMEDGSRFKWLLDHFSDVNFIPLPDDRPRRKKQQ